MKPVSFHSRNPPGAAMPANVRRAVVLALAGAIAVAIGLIAIRGPAILIDLGAGAGQLFCL